jgi:hypothetical protein
MHRVRVSCPPHSPVLFRSASGDPVDSFAAEITPAETSIDNFQDNALRQFRVGSVVKSRQAR